jgi:ADP-heptose:LPS heptosyltransferase
LIRLLSSCEGIDELHSQDNPPAHFDVRASLISLPGILGTTLATIPNQVPYVFTAPVLVDHWRAELAKSRDFKIGIAWQGNPGFGGDRHRSVPLLHYASLAQIDGVKLFSLQKGAGTEQLARVADRVPVSVLEPLDEGGGAFMDTAAVMKSLDLVITSDTAIAHLAGALAVPVWVAIPFAPDWRWLLGRTDNPWYPTMRLFRQPEPGNWQHVFQRMAESLAIHRMGTIS